MEKEINLDKELANNKTTSSEVDTTKEIKEVDETTNESLGEKSNKNDELLRNLDFGTTPKILSNEDMKNLIGKNIWLISQRDYGPTDYESSCYYNVTGIESDNKLEIKSLESEWPCVSADKNELADILQERGYRLTHQGRSGFASRNRYIISKPSPQVISTKAPLLIQCRMDKDEKEKFGIVSSDNSSSWQIIWTGEMQEKEIISPNEIKEVKDIIEKAKHELKQRRVKRMDEHIKSQKNGFISIVDIGGGPEDFHEYDIPENYLIIAQKRIACTQDYRRNITHTYSVVLIDTNAIQGKSFIKIKIPDEYKGLVIGKGGGNIKSLCEKLKCRIMIE
ncbi:MAG TPA: KH domain-containing protein [Candidatus Absconditabacterales bacterium]|nr:KH domain-containing protein [Candidatus Absconditabacterales bacterium]